MTQVISTKATEIIKKHFPYYEEEFANEYKLKLHACLFEYADYIANERLKNISSNTMLAVTKGIQNINKLPEVAVCFHTDEWTNLNGGDYWCRKCETYAKNRKQTDR